MAVERAREFGDERLIARINAVGLELDAPYAMDALLDRVGDARYVLLGEASHGTSEFYTWRARLSQRLIREKGFSFVAVEGDWPDCYMVNRYVKGYPESGDSARQVLQAFNRWPTWMWANWEMVAFAEWLREYNAGPENVGFYGLDVYSLWDSMDAVIDYLEDHDPGAVDMARQAYRCFEPFGENEHAYAWSTRLAPESCEDEVVRVLAELRRRAPQYATDAEATFDAEQNALVTVDAERYYRAMMRSDSGSWNVRDEHMTDTLDRLMALHGSRAKAIVWAHNTHVGDARATDMARQGMVNIGQLVRKRHAGDGVVLVGFGAHHGSVIAGREWGAPMQRLTVPAARHGSWEDVLHRANAGNQLLILDTLEDDPEFLAVRDHRAIGVVYSPEFERLGNYVPTVLPNRYDAFLYIDDTEALHPLHLPSVTPNEPPETYPWGV